VGELCSNELNKNPDFSDSDPTIPLFKTAHHRRFCKDKIYFQSLDGGLQKDATHPT